MAKSTYYFEISKTDAVAIRNQDLMVEIREIFKKNKGRYGVRRVHRELLNRGHKVNHKRVQRLMHTMELKGKRPKEKYHSYQGEKGKIAENIIDRDFSTTGPLQKWIQVHFKNGRPMFPSSIFHGANAICRQSWI